MDFLFAHLVIEENIVTYPHILTYHHHHYQKHSQIMAFLNVIE
jgi:ABC-type proline/glycine betaine transport system ATPase subunit